MPKLRFMSLLLVTMVVTGCSSGQPSDLESPDVVWPESPPVTEFDDSPYVQAFRANIYEATIAWNNLDYTDPDLIRHGGHKRAAWLTEHGRGSLIDAYIWLEIDQGADPSVYLVQGPETIIPTKVTPHSDNTAYVEYCSQPGPDSSEHEASGGRVFITLYDDGSSTVSRAGFEPGSVTEHLDYCRTLDMPVAKFDPAPTPITSPTPGSIRPPLPPKAYDFESSDDR